MKETTSRRLFLQRSAMATAGLTLLPSTFNPVFPSVSPYEGYNPYAEEKTDLRTKLFDKQVRIKGIIYDETGNTPLTGATVEIWHLSPGSSKFRHRGKMHTDAHGKYNFITDFPNRKLAQTSRVYFKVTHQKSTIFTEIGVDHSGAYITSVHWEKNQQLGDRLFPTTQKLFNTSIINFNISIS